MEQNNKSFKEKWFKTGMKILQDEEVNNEIKLFIILDMLHHREISKNKARELCTEVGLFNGHWLVIDSETTDVWLKYWKEDD